MLRGIMTGGRETTRASKENTVTTKVLMAMWIGLAGTLMIIAGFFAGWFIWLFIRLQMGATFLEWFTGWKGWFGKWWALEIALVFLWWASLPGTMLIIKFVQELWDEHWPPVRKAAPPELGVLGPFPSKKRRSEMQKAYERFYGEWEEEEEK